MKKNIIRIFFSTAVLCACAVLFIGCKAGTGEESAEHEPLTVSTAGMDYREFDKLLSERYPEVRLQYISYTGSNATGYAQYVLRKGDVPDIYGLSVFSMQNEQKQNLIDLSGYEFLNNYKTADINQVTLDGAVYLVPASSAMIGLYYNKTMFEEHGWKVPQNFEELKQLTLTIQNENIDPVAAQFELPGNGFFDVFTMAKTAYLSTPEGLQWERDFKEGKATAREGISDAVEKIQELIDCGFLDEEDTGRNYAECVERFYSREAAMYLNAGTVERFTENEDGTGDRYGIMPFYGKEKDEEVLISMPLRYFGLSKTLEEPGNEQKLDDAKKVMELLATEEGQKSLGVKLNNYIAPLKNTEIPKDSPFYEVEETIRSGYTSTLAYAGYEALVIDVGNEVRDWVAGESSGEEVLDLMDRLQADALNGSIPVVAEAAQDFTIEQTAQLQAEAFRRKAGTDFGIVSLGGYHNGVENSSGVCGKIYKGEIALEVVNAVVPGIYNEPVCVLTLTGGEIKKMLTTGLMVEGDAQGFPYVAAGLTVTKDSDGIVKSVIMEDGSALKESGNYTVAVDKGGFSEEIGQNGEVEETEFIVADTVEEYFRTNSPLKPLESDKK